MKRLAALLCSIVLCAIALVPALRGSPTIGVVVQKWYYNPQNKIATITLANSTQKDILAYNLTITTTYVNGSTDRQEVKTDLLDRMINARLVKGTPDEAQFTQRFGNGTFAALTITDQNVSESEAPKSMQIVVDMVAYVDQTADVQNERAFAQLVASRKGELLALQLANEVTQQALTNPNPRDAAVTELKRQINVLHTQNLAPTDPQRYEETYLQNAIDNLQNAQHGLPETEHLKNLVAMRQQRIALAAPYAQLNKTTGGAQ
jgi:hypothetical protein